VPGYLHLVPTGHRRFVSQQPALVRDLTVLEVALCRYPEMRNLKCFKDVTPLLTNFPLSYSTGKQSRSFAKVTGPGKLFLISDKVSVSLPNVRSIL
jgi:hypothetical protein